MKPKTIIAFLISALVLSLFTPIFASIVFLSVLVYQAFFKWQDQKNEHRHKLAALVVTQLSMEQLEQRLAALERLKPPAML